VVPFPACLHSSVHENQYHNSTILYPNLWEKLRRDCKTLIHRFDSDRRFQDFHQT
jgi:hypothetical protein